MEESKQKKCEKCQWKDDPIEYCEEHDGDEESCLWNEAGVNGEIFRTNASDDDIEEIWNALVVICQEDAQHLKEALELNGFLCGPIERHRLSLLRCKNDD